MSAAVFSSFALFLRGNGIADKSGIQTIALKGFVTKAVKRVFQTMLSMPLELEDPPNLQRSRRARTSSARWGLRAWQWATSASSSLMEVYIKAAN